MAYFDYFGGGMSDGSAPVDPASIGFETEEERRRRLERERMAAGQTPTTAPVKPTPVKETITTDPVTGERKVKIEGTERDLSALNTRTPTVTMPGQEPRMQTLPADLTRPQPEMQTLPADLTRPQPEMQNLAQAPAAAPVAPVAPQLEPAATQPQSTGIRMPAMTQQLMPGETAGMPTAAPTPEYETLMQGAAVNPRVRNRLITDPNTPADVRRAAITLERRALEQERETGAAQKELQKAVESGNFNALARKIKQETEGGSILKALFYKSIGMTNLALEEEKKMGAGRKWQTAIDPDTNERAFIEYDADGLPLSGFDSSGQEISAQRLAAFGAGGMAGNLDIVGGSYVNDQTREVGRMVTDKRTGRSFIQTDKGLRPMEGFRPQGQGGTLDMQQAQRVMQANVALAQDWAQLQNRVRAAAPEAQNRFLGEFNAKHGTNYRLADLGGAPPQLDLQTGRMSMGAPAQTAPAMPAAPAQPAAPAAPAAAAPAVSPTAPTAPAAPVAPGSPSARLTPTQPNLAPVTGARPGQSPAQIEQDLAISGAGREAEVKAVSEDVAKAKINNNKIIEQANTVEALTTQLLEHPGFANAVGTGDIRGMPAPGAGAIAGLIPGSETYSFNAFFEQLKGNAFLTGIEAMKGLGALSDREGQAATQAIAALDTGMSEKDFRKALHQLNTTLRRAADRNAVKAGKEPPFNEPDLNTQAKQNREAQAWLKKAKPGGKNADGTTITQEQIDGVTRRLRLRGEIE